MGVNNPYSIFLYMRLVQQKFRNIFTANYQMQIFLENFCTIIINKIRFNKNDSLVLGFIK